jgi:hypothetical protein
MWFILSSLHSFFDGHRCLANRDNRVFAGKTRLSWVNQRAGPNEGLMVTRASVAMPKPGVARYMAS